MSTPALVATLIGAIALIIVLIIKFKLHASLALIIAAFVTALVARVPLGEITDVLEDGVGGTLGFLTLIIGFGAILGKLLEVSGGAERLASTMLNALGTKRATLAMSILGFITGIPVFVEVGFVLLVPLVFVVAKEAGISRIKVGIPLAVSLMIVHCILPPHPAATAIAGTLGADIGTVIIAGILVGLPAALIAGPLYAHFAIKDDVVGEAAPAEEAVEAKAETTDRELPGFGITLLTVLMPLLLMVTRTIALEFVSEESLAGRIISLVGSPITALLLSVLFAYFSLGFSRGMNRDEVLKLTESSFAPIAGILLIIGAGGAFNAVLTASGIAPALATALSGLAISPVILAWLIALVLHFAVGSATVAMISAAGIVLPMLALNPDIAPATMAIAIGAGAIGLTHVTDSLFWMVKEYLHMSVPQALKTLTVATTIASVVGLGGAMVVNVVL
ncbi:gluconate:H+ symporter [Propionibacteriaceae bacterium Y1923]